MVCSSTWAYNRRIDKQWGDTLKYLLLTFVIIPVIEIVVLLLFGQAIGVTSTLLLILFTGVIGAYLARRQGLNIIRKVQVDIEQGIMPGEAMLDGVCILAGGILLLIPGFVTDAVGLFMFIPATRRYLKNWLSAIFRRRMDRRTITIIR